MGNPQLACLGQLWVAYGSCTGHSGSFWVIVGADIGLSTGNYIYICTHTHIYTHMYTCIILNAGPCWIWKTRWWLWYCWGIQWIQNCRWWPNLGVWTYDLWMGSGLMIFGCGETVDLWKTSLTHQIGCVIMFDTRIKSPDQQRLLFHGPMLSPPSIVRRWGHHLVRKDCRRACHWSSPPVSLAMVERAIGSCGDKKRLAKKQGMES